MLVRIIERKYLRELVPTRKNPPSNNIVAKPSLYYHDLRKKERCHADESHPKPKKIAAQQQAINICKPW